MVLNSWKMFKKPFLKGIKNKLFKELFIFDRMIKPHTNIMEA